MSESKTVAAFWGQVPPLSAPLALTHGGTLTCGRLRKAACVQVNIPPVIRPPPHVKVTLSRWSRGPKHSRCVSVRGWKTWDFFTDLTCTFGVKPAFLCPKNGILNVANCVWLRGSLLEACWNIENLKVWLNECQWKQQESQIHWSHIFTEQMRRKCWRRKTVGQMTERTFFLWWGSFWVSASISACTFETTDLLWDKQRLSGTYFTQDHRGCCELCGKCTIAS